MEPGDEPRQGLHQQFGRGAPLPGDRDDCARFLLPRGLLEAHDAEIHTPFLCELQALDGGLTGLVHAHPLGRADLGIGLVGLEGGEALGSPRKLTRRIEQIERGE